MRSSLEIYDLSSGRSDVVFQSDDVIEAPNWDPGRATLLFNGGGRLFRVAVTGGTPEAVETGFATACNNDHGISPDGDMIALSHHAKDGSRIYTLPADGGTPALVTPTPGSYWHGWSPDRAQLAFCGRRNGQYDIYTVPVSGGEELQLTGRRGFEGHNDGPDYAPDGRHIWFNSDRSGHAQLWRMGVDGAEPRQMSDDACVNWFPHPSPDGAHVLYLAYPPGTLGHPPDLPVELRLMDPEGRGMSTLLSFTGGQGTINVPCWAADGRAFAYVRYA